MTSRKNSILDPAISIISTSEMRGIFISLAEGGDSVNLRFRLLGEMWQHSFMRVIIVNNNSVVFRDEVKNNVVLLSDLRTIMQLELDGSFFSLESNFHYDVSPA